MMNITNDYEIKLNQLSFAGATGLAKFSLNTIISLCESQDIADFKELVNEIQTLYDITKKHKPSRAPIENSIEFVLNRAKHWTVSCDNLCDFKSKVKNAALSFEDFIEKAQTQTVKNAVKVLSNTATPITLMTICRSTTVINTIVKLSKLGLINKVVVLEARPDFDGWETAKALGKEGVHVELIADSAALSFIETIDTVVVGADVVLDDGSVINRVGTYPLSMFARNYDKYFYVVTASYTFRNLPSQNVVLAKRDPNKLVPKEISNKWENIVVTNQVDDLTPSNYLTGIICETGVLKPNEITNNIQRFNSWINNTNSILWNESI